MSRKCDFDLAAEVVLIESCAAGYHASLEERVIDHRMDQIGVRLCLPCSYNDLLSDPSGLTRAALHHAPNYLFLLKHYGGGQLTVASPQQPVDLEHPANNPSR